MTKIEKLKKLICLNLTTSIELMEYLKSVASDKESKETCNKCIRNGKKALKMVLKIKHDNLVHYLYNMIYGCNASLFVVPCSFICGKDFARYDTDDGNKEFMETLKKQSEEQKKAYQEQQEQKLAIEKAKKEGKKIEFVLDKDTKKLKPTIVENNNA